MNSLAYCKTNDSFEKIGEPICDAIVFPKCPLLFDSENEPYKQMQLFFTKMGLPVSFVYQAAKSDCVFIQLEDARNAFTDDLMMNLRKAVSVLTLRTYAILKK